MVGAYPACTAGKLEAGAAHKEIMTGSSSVVHVTIVSFVSITVIVKCMPWSVHVYMVWGLPRLSTTAERSILNKEYKPAVETIVVKAMSFTALKLLPPAFPHD